MLSIRQSDEIYRANIRWEQAKGDEVGLFGDLSRLTGDLAKAARKRESARASKRLQKVETAFYEESIESLELEAREEHEMAVQALERGDVEAAKRHLFNSEVAQDALVSTRMDRLYD